jgi:hypothetical protein
MTVHARSSINVVPENQYRGDIKRSGMEYSAGQNKSGLHFLSVGIVQERDSDAMKQFHHTHNTNLPSGEITTKLLGNQEIIPFFIGRYMALEDAWFISKPLRSRLRQIPSIVLYRLNKKPSS